MEWLGLFGDDAVPASAQCPLDALCAAMLPRMQYTEGQRDMLLMQHTYEVEYADRRDTLTTTLADFGVVDGDSSMSRTVSLPIAIVIDAVLSGRLQLAPGLHIPIKPSMYNLILDSLDKDFGIRFHDAVVKSTPK